MDITTKKMDRVSADIKNIRRLFKAITALLFLLEC